MFRTFNEFLFLTAIAGFVFIGTHASEINKNIENKNTYNEKVLNKSFPQWYFSDWRYTINK